MRVYIDKLNLLEYCKSTRNDKYSDSLTMIKNHCNVHFTFPKTELDFEKENEYLQAFIKSCTDGFTAKWSWNDLFPSRPIASNLVTLLNSDYSKLTSTFLIDDDKAKALKQKGQLVVAEPGEEVNTLSKFWFSDLQYQVDIFDQITQWRDLNQYSMPCSDIIIVDQFILKEKSLCSRNLYTILEALCKEIKQARVNILIFTGRFDEVTTVDLSNIRDGLITHLKSKTQAIPTVTIIAAHKDVLDEHDRSIVTNYRLMNSGDSFNYFDENGIKKTRGRFLTLASIASETTQKKCRDIISHLQTVYDSVKSSNPLFIIKDSNSESNYLTL